MSPNAPGSMASNTTPGSASTPRRPRMLSSPARAADRVEGFGAERVVVNSAGDWGHSDPLAVPEFIFEMRARGNDPSLIRKVVFDNPLAFFSQCRRFRSDTLSPEPRAVRV